MCPIGLQNARARLRILLSPCSRPGALTRRPTDALDQRQAVSHTGTKPDLRKCGPIAAVQRGPLPGRVEDGLAGGRRDPRVAVIA